MIRIVIINYMITLSMINDNVPSDRIAVISPCEVLLCIANVDACL